MEATLAAPSSSWATLSLPLGLSIAVGLFSLLASATLVLPVSVFVALLLVQLILMLSAGRLMAHASLAAATPLLVGAIGGIVLGQVARTVDVWVVPLVVLVTIGVMTILALFVAVVGYDFIDVGRPVSMVLLVLVILVMADGLLPLHLPIAVLEIVATALLAGLFLHTASSVTWHSHRFSPLGLACSALVDGVALTFGVLFVVVTVSGG